LAANAGGQPRLRAGNILKCFAAASYWNLVDIVRQFDFEQIAVCTAE